MADNYLERQMEQYQARKAAWERERKFGKKKAASALRNKTKQSENPASESPKK